MHSIQQIGVYFLSTFIPLQISDKDMDKKKKKETRKNQIKHCKY